MERNDVQVTGPTPGQFVIIIFKITVCLGGRKEMGGPLLSGTGTPPPPPPAETLNYIIFKNIMCAENVWTISKSHV